MKHSRPRRFPLDSYDDLKKALLAHVKELRHRHYSDNDLPGIPGGLCAAIEGICSYEGGHVNTLKYQILDLSYRLQRNAYDELAEDLRTFIHGDGPEDDCGVYGEDLT